MYTGRAHKVAKSFDFAVSKMTLRRVKLKANLPKDLMNSGQVTEVAFKRHRGKYNDIIQITYAGGPLIALKERVHHSLESC